MATIYGNREHFATQAVLVACEYGNTKVTVKDEQAPVAVPLGVRPTLVNGKQVLCGPLPITWWGANGQLRGQKKEHEADVLCWMNAAESVYRPAIMSWVLPATSCMEYDKKAFETAKADAEHLLQMLNDFLLTQTFLVGERLSLADINMAFAILPAYQHVLESAQAKCKYGNLTRWFQTVMHQPQVKKVVGELRLCTKASQFDAAQWKQNQQKLQASAAASTSKKQEGGKKDKAKGDAQSQKKEDKKKEKPKKEVEEDDGMDATEQVLAQEKEAKDPFLEMPKGTFNMDEFKRTYSNCDTATVAIPYFWEKFDTENYSIWRCDYKYSDELTLAFMSANLIGGMFQRLDKMRKHAFGSMILFGTDNNSSISGIWFWRGHKLAFELSPDWQVDYESYDWKKLDPKDPATKKQVNEYLAWEGEFDGKKFNQGKIFK